MAGAPAERLANHLIDGLPVPDRERILTDSRLVELPLGRTLCEVGERLVYVYFPLAGFVALVATLPPRQALEAGLVGTEGMIGATLALGVEVAPVRGVVQGEGSALQMTSGGFERLLRDSPALRRVLNRYLYVLVRQVLRTSLCAHYHEIRPRLARWLLMTQDRVGADQFLVTHEMLASMLGVRRSGVTVAAGTLQERNLITYARGRISILDRRGLAAIACDCYHVLLDDYDAFLGCDARSKRPAVARA